MREGRAGVWVGVCSGSAMLEGASMPLRERKAQSFGAEAERSCHGPAWNQRLRGCWRPGKKRNEGGEGRGRGEGRGGGEGRWGWSPFAFPVAFPVVFSVAFAVAFPVAFPVVFAVVFAVAFPVRSSVASWVACIWFQTTYPCTVHTHQQMLVYHSGYMKPFEQGKAGLLRDGGSVYRRGRATFFGGFRTRCGNIPGTKDVREYYGKWGR